MNVVLLTGNLVRDPESMATATGTKLTRFTIAVNRNVKREEGKPDADFIRVTCFGNQADFVDRYLSKGRKIGVEGRIQTGSYQDKDGKTIYTTDVIANRVEFLDSKRDAEGGGGGFGGQFQDRQNAAYEEAPKQTETPEAPAAAEASAGLPDPFAIIDDDDDMPF